MRGNLKILARAPTRVDIAGGTLDISPLSRLLDKPTTVNVAVSIYASVAVEPSSNGLFEFHSADQSVSVCGAYREIIENNELPLYSLLLKHYWFEDWPALKFRVDALSPKGAGLGGSSCLAVTFLGALEAAHEHYFGKKKFADEAQFLQFVQDVETELIKVPTGCQDYWGAYRGGVNVIDFPPGGVHCETYKDRALTFFHEHLILCYSGQSRDSAINNWQIFKRAFDGDPAVLRGLNRLSDLARQTAKEVRCANYEAALASSHEEWLVRKELWPGIATPETERLAEAARSHGASFSRVCGAGGGGVMAIFVKPERRSDVMQALTKAHGVVLDGKAVNDGLSVRSAP